MRISDQEFNQLLILKTIRRLEPIARKELADRTGLAGGTITRIINDLIDHRVVTEERVTTRQRGRPRLHLRINPEGGYVIGACLLPDHTLAFEIVNLRGDCVRAETLALQEAQTLEGLALEIAGRIREAIGASPIRKRDIHRVGLTLPAIVDRARGTVLLLATYPESPVPFAGIIQDRIRLPVVIDNSSSMMARAEHWFGTADRLDNFTLIALDIGVGAAYYMDGMLWSGANSINAEFGHSKIGDDDGVPCICGASGCLMMQCGIYGVVSRIAQTRDREPPSVSDLPRVEATLAEYVADARAGDAEAQRAFNRAGRLLGLAASNHINAFDPGRVVVAIKEPGMLEMIREPFLAAVDDNTLPILRDRTDLELKRIDDTLLWQGAAALGLEAFYRSS